MFRNYIKTALRSLSRHRFFSFINIFGLSIAMAICLGIIMLVADQMTYDRYNTKRDRIYRVTTNMIGKDGIEHVGNTYATSCLNVRNELLENYTGIEKATRIMRGFGNGWIEFEQDVNIPLAGFYADNDVLDIFEYELEHGDKNTALIEPYSVVLTKTAAKKLFKQDNPVGESIKVGDLGTYKITGVLKETTKKSHIVFDAFASISTVKSLGRTRDLESWQNFTMGWVYVLLEKEKNDPSALAAAFDKMFKTHYAPITNPDDSKLKFQLQSLMSITPGPFHNNPIGPFLPWIFIYFFAGLAGIVLLTSCFNFTNLSIARSLTRAREIGVRKVNGAARWQIFVQFISESILVALFALAIAIVFLLMAKPFLYNLNFARVFRWDLEGNYAVYAVFVGFALVVGILAGFFPAVVLSGFQPIKVLKNFGSMKLFSRMGLRKTLLVAQFTLSLIFILSVIVVFNQLQLFLKADHGFKMENRMVVRLNKTSAQALKNELLTHSNIESVSAASHIPAAGTTYGNGFKKSLDEKEWTNINYFQVDEDYLTNIEVELVAGRFFTAEAGESNKNFIVLNEKAVESLHYGSAAAALGEEIIYQADSSRKQIIGVVKNYNHQLLMEKMDPMGLMYNADGFNLLQVKYNGTYEDASKSVEAAWAKVNPALRVDYKGFEDEIKLIYNIFFGDLVTIMTGVSIVAILISCLGLLGMATYATETRIKEISIRKVLGSSNGSLIVLLSKSFVWMLVIAIIIAVPAAYFLNTLWLEFMAYHVAVNVGTVLLGVAILIFFGVITIGSQTLRATYVKPVENLKSE